MVYVDPRVTGEYVVQKNSLTELEFEPSLNPMISHFLCIEGGLKGKKVRSSVFILKLVDLCARIELAMEFLS